MTVGQSSRLYDARQLLLDPNLMTELFIQHNKHADIEEKSGKVFVPSSERQPGSGRPKGSYFLKSEVVEAVTSLLETAGTPAHSRFYTEYLNLNSI